VFFSLTCIRVFITFGIVRLTSKLMKRFLALFILMPVLSLAQAPFWQWASQSIGNGHDYGFNIDTDSEGNSYVTGTYQPPMMILGTDTLISSTAFNSGFFIAKYDKQGHVIWAKSITGDAAMNATSIRLNNSGDAVVVTGYFKSTGKISFGTDSIESSAFFDVYLAKYDTAGNSLWTINAGQSAWNGQINYDVKLDDSGNIYVAGTFEDSVYLKKFDGTGAELWNKKYFGGVMNTFFWNLDVTPSGESIVAGYFSNTSLMFDTSFVPLSSNGYTIVLVKNDAQGNVQWAKSDGHIASLYKPDIAFDAQGNFYVTGYFNGPTCQFANYILTNLGADDIFLVKYDSHGNVLWAQHAGGFHFDIAYSVTTDHQLNCYITGMFRAVATFGPHTLFNAGDPDIFVTKYDANGNALWAKQAGGVLVDVGYGVSVDDSTNCYVTGRFTSPAATFDMVVLNNSSPQWNPYEFFVARLGKDNLTGFAETGPDDQFIVYPNPLVDESVLVIPGESQSGTYEIFDIRGSLVRKVIFNGNQVLLKRESLLPGTYLIRLTTDHAVSSMLLMVND